MLRYEDLNNVHHILDKLETTLKIKINNKNQLANKYNINTIKHEIADLKDFSVYRTDTHWHGNHISSDSFEEKKCEKNLSENHMNMIKKQLDFLVIKLGYSQ
jgi:hypothetical protein